jgi:hypothetical protein
MITFSRELGGGGAYRFVLQSVLLHYAFWSYTHALKGLRWVVNGRFRSAWIGKHTWSTVPFRRLCLSLFCLWLWFL